jgi:hypothetical protein
VLSLKKTLLTIIHLLCDPRLPKILIVRLSHEVQANAKSGKKHEKEFFTEVT